MFRNVRYKELLAYRYSRIVGALHLGCLQEGFLDGDVGRVVLAELGFDGFAGHSSLNFSEGVGADGLSFRVRHKLVDGLDAKGSVVAT